MQETFKVAQADDLVAWQKSPWDIEKFRREMMYVDVVFVDVMVDVMVYDGLCIIVAAWFMLTVAFS